MTREHIFRSSWRKKLDVNLGLGALGITVAEAEKRRRFIRYGLDNAEKKSTQEDLFSLTVKRVCAPCNNKWMNDLDSVVEPWVFDPDDDDNRCDPSAFRRWAMKVAVLRCHYEHPTCVEPGDPQKICDGDDIPEWHVFIGRTQLPEHRHAHCGVGPIVPPGGRLLGITQVTWTLQYSFVTAIRLVGDNEFTQNGIRNFKRFNRLQGIKLLEILPNSTVMPRVSTLPELTRREIQSLAWFFTPHPASPIASEVRKMIATIEEVAKQYGIPTQDL